MKLEEYVEYIERYEIPPEPPDFTLNPPHFSDGSFDSFKARDVCTERGCWTVIADTWIKQLADYIDGRNVLEIMAGAGWLAKGLENHNVRIWATDNHTWDKRHSMMKPLTDIAQIEAFDAVVESPDADILIVSWPPYDDKAVVRACEVWSARGPIVYIGEDHGGCNAPDEFFEHFSIDDNAPNISIPQWWGLHDMLTIGYWDKTY